MIAELLLQERRQDFPFLGGISITQAGTASFQCFKVSMTALSRRCTSCLIDEFGAILLVMHDKYFVLI